MKKVCCKICNKIFSPIYVSQHKKTLLHLKNAYEYYVEGRIEARFEDYFVIDLKIILLM